MSALVLLRHWKLIVGALAIIASFGAGWRVNGMRCDARVAKIERAADKARARQQTNVETQATRYEQERENANEAQANRETIIRTKYVPVAGTCDPGPSVASVLDDALDDARRAASGEPRAAMPEPSPTP